MSAYEIFTFFLKVAIALIAYMWLMGRCAKLLAPMRMHFAVEGEKFIANTHDERARKHMQANLDNAFSAFWAIAFAMTIPLFGLINIITEAWSALRHEQRQAPAFSKAEREEQQLNVMFLASVAGANPIFGAIIAVELLLLFSLSALLTGQITVAKAVIRSAASSTSELSRSKLHWNG